ncbi:MULTISPECIES: hypothetical protein [unclassified Sphingobium]|uniref:hypothetical protein n=1 Tax=unclassified Sphingobium TaxID=2611147 RepID=UPI002224DBE2|nr:MULTISPECIES: hypothetical protein [unclassified Sphingobium]MCW2396139.1 hypothetical protein [Sphingobium sp. B8D3B]MCW2419655.1 hypothetical protein [Sphingobium sp. B8D3C]
MPIKMKTCLALSTATLLAVSPAFAEDARYSVGVTAGTLGAGPEVGMRINDTFGVRASASFFDFSHDIDVNDLTYEGKLKLESYGAVADVYPFGGGFRLSGGFRIAKNRVSATATPTEPVTIGDVTYTPSEIGTLSGTIRAKDFAPLLTVGYAGGLRRGIKFGVDAGAMFQGTPRVDALRATGSLATNAAFQEQLLKEQADVNDEVNKYKVYPVLQFSLFYAF